MCGNNISKWPLFTIKQRSGPIVGIDVDGVLRNIDPAISKIMEDKYPKAKLVNPKAWGFSEKYTNVPKGAEYPLFNNYAEDIFYDSLEYPGATKFMYELDELIKKYKGKIYIVTKQASAGGVETLRWVAKHKIKFHAIFVIRSNQSKVAAECDILLDDHIKNLNEQKNNYGNAMCMARVWNVDWPDKRYSTYNEILKDIEIKLKELTELDKKFKTLSKEEKIMAMLQNVS